MNRKILIGAPVVLITLLAVALVAPGFVDWSKYKTQIQDQIKTATGHTANIGGDLSLAILPSPRVHISDVSVAAPAGSAQPHLIKLGRLDVNLALFPLLSGKIDFDTVSLVEPDVALEIMKDGRPNWITPELEKMTAGQPETGAKSPAISLKNIRIEKGRFAYADQSKGEAAPLMVENINITAKADSLQGPFGVNGEIDYSGRTVSVKATTQAIEPGSTSVSVKLGAEIAPENVNVQFAGAVDTVAPFRAQGETKITIPSMGKLAGPGFGDEKLSLEGLMTASQQKVEFKDMTLALGNSLFKGSMDAALDPMKINANLASNDTVSLDKFIKPTKKGSSAGGPLLPETLALPLSFDAGVRLSAPSLVYNSQVYNNIELTLSKQGGLFAAEFKAGGIPGKGNLDAKAAAKYASSSASKKDGGVVYSDPALVVAAKGQTQNIAQTAGALSGMDLPPALSAFKTAKFDTRLDIKPDLITLQQTQLTLDGSPVAVSGSYAPAKDGGRAKIVADLIAEALDLDALQQKMGSASAKSASLEDSLRGLAMPFDIDMDVGIQKARLQGRDIKGLRATGTFRENAASFSNLSAQDFAGAAFKLSGGIGNIKALSDIDVTVSGQAGDAKELAKMAGYDITALPKSLEKATVALNAKGALDRLAVNADINALDGTLTARGDVADPLKTMALSNLAIQVKHPNLASALQAFFPNSPRYVSLEKPLDLIANVDRNGNVYSLSNMKASIAGSPVTGSVSFDTGAAKPTLKADLTFDKLNIQSAGGGAARSSSGSSNGSRWSSEPMDTAWMNSMNADIKVKAGSLVYEGWDLRQPVIDIALANGTLDIRQFESALFGGRMAVDGRMSAGPGNKGFSNVSAAANFQNVLLEELTGALTGGTNLLRGQGAVTMKADIATSGPSQAALISALSGGGTVKGQDVVLDGFDLGRFAAAMSDENKPADTLQGLWKGVNRGGSTRFDTVDGAFSINKGIVNFDRMLMTGPEATVSTAGTINLPTWMLDSAHTITLPTPAPPAEAVPPFTVKIAGPLDNPAQTFGQGAINDYFNRKLNRKLQDVISDKVGGDAGNLLGTFLGVPPKQPAPAPAPTPVVDTPVETQQLQPADTIEPAASETVPLLSPEEQAIAERRALKKKQAEQKAAEEAAKQEAIQGVLKGLLGGQ